MVELSEEHCSEFVTFLEEEELFLDRADRCAQQIAQQPAAGAFPSELIQELIDLHQLNASRVQHRAKFQRELSTLGYSTQTRFADMQFAESARDGIHERRRRVNQKGDVLRRNLRALNEQLAESNTVLTKIVDFLAGNNSDALRYDGAGRPVRGSGLGRRISVN